MKKCLTIFLITLLFIVTSAFAVLAAPTADTQSAAKDELVMVIAVTRHGDRTPFTQIKNSPVDWGIAPSELTPTGMQQEFQLGQSLRQRYVNELKFLPEQYVPNSMYVLSSGTNRTIMSAESLLYGFYPLGTGPKLPNGLPALPSAFQPIPIRTLADDSDEIMIQYTRLVETMTANVYSQPYWQEKTQQYRTDMERWTKILGNEVKTLGDVMTVGDTMIVRSKHGIPLPKGMTEEDADKLMHLSDWALASEFSSAKVAYICGGKLFNTIINEINKKVQGKNNYKFMLYSGHDISLMPLMTLLGSPLEKAPGYASHMEFEIYHLTGGDYSVKVRYNGDYVSFPIMKGKSQINLAELNSLSQDYAKQFAN